MGLFRKKERETDQGETIFCGAVIAAAGASSRMGGMDKLTADLQGEPVLIRAIRPFQASAYIREIVVVTRADRLVEISRLCREFGLTKVRLVTVGGETRSQSVQKGLQSLSKEIRLAAVHDGDRPLVTETVLEGAVRKAAKCGAAAPAVPVTDTVKVAKGGLVLETPDRKTLFAVQTPQVFDRDLLEAALTKAEQDGAALTDDCGAVERLGMHVHLTEGSASNIKITTVTDLILANALLGAELP